MFRKFLSFALILALILPAVLTNFVPNASAEEGTISVADAIANNSGTATVEGYVVAHAKGTNSYGFEAPFANDYNLVLADSPAERENVKLLPVQIPSSNRSEFGLQTNPDLIGKKIQVTGNLEAYFSTPGLKNPTSFKLMNSDPSEPPVEEPGTVISIADGKKKTGQDITVEGVVTADNSAIGGGKLSTYIQDETAGINVFSIDAAQFPELKEGQKIKVTGKVTIYNKLTEIVPGQIEVISENNELSEAKDLTLKDLQSETTAEPLEGQLVKVKGFVQSIPGTPAGGGYNVSIIDEEYNGTTLRIMEGTNAISALEPKKWYEFTAIASQYNSYQLLPRKAEDLKLLDPQPEAPKSAGEYTSTVASVVDGDTVHLQTPVLGTTKVRYVNMDTPETYHKVVTDADESQKYHGEQAKAYLNELLKPGDEVIVKVGEETTDDYGRLLAQVVRKSDGMNTNLELVKKGYASTYFIWPVGDAADYALFQAAVKEAKDANLGIWNPENPLMELPFEFRAREQGKGLTRFVGNSETKKFVTPEKWEEVPVESRVFFVSPEEAESAGYSALDAPDNGEDELVSLQLLGMNDLHGKIDQSYQLDINGDKVNDGTYGRIDYLSAYLKEREASNPNTLMVYSGDMIGGSSPVSSLFQDEPTVEMMEEIGFDVGAVGNHEFDEGTAELLRILNGGEHPEGKGTAGYDGQNFPLVCANCEYKEDGSEVLPAYEVKEVDGVKVGFIGVVTENAANMIIPEGIKDIQFTDETQAVNEAAAELKAQGIRAIVVLGHLSAEQNGDAITGEAADLAMNADDEIDVISAGHDHKVANGLVDNKLIVQALDYGKAFSDIELKIDRSTGDIVQKEAEIVYVDQSKIQPDPVVAGILSKYQNQVEGIMNELVGTAALDMQGGYGVKGLIGDNALGNLIADGMVAAMDSDFALMNGGGIRDNLNAGEITWGELYNIQPFGNVLTKLEIKGADLFPIMNAQLSEQYGPDYSIGGFTYTWDASTTKVTEIYLKNGEKINKEATYTITVNNFMATSTGSKYRPIGELGKNPVTGPEDLEATVNFVKSFDGPISYAAEGRISDDILAPVTEASLSEPDLENGKYSKADVTLVATDAGTGLKETQYKIGDGEWIPYTAPVAVGEKGEQTIFYRSIDKARNMEAEKSITVTIEETKEIDLNHVKTLIQNSDAKKGTKALLQLQIMRAEVHFELSKIFPSLRSYFENKGYTVLKEVKSDVKQYSNSVMSAKDKKEIVAALQFVIENRTETN